MNKDDQMNTKDLTGMRFGRLTVIERMPDRVSNSGYHEAMWRCKCDCGNEIVTKSKSLTRNVSRSCGCLIKDIMSARAKHHGFGTRLYNIWNSMRQRCNNPNNHAYHNYGGRGIEICKEWDDYNVFREWAISNGYDEDAPRGQCTLDRIDVNGDYSPENCRWATMLEQGNNKRGTICIEYNGVSRTITEWSEITGLDRTTIHKRYKKGLPPEEILKTA